MQCAQVRIRGHLLVHVVVVRHAPLQPPLARRFRSSLAELSLAHNEYTSVELESIEKAEAEVKAEAEGEDERDVSRSSVDVRSSGLDLRAETLHLHTLRLDHNRTTVQAPGERALRRRTLARAMAAPAGTMPGAHAGRSAASTGAASRAQEF